MNARLLMDSAAHYAREAIRLDPDFAQPHGVLGTYYFVMAFRGWAPFAAYVDSSQAAAARALAADSTVGDPWINVMSKAIYLDDDWPAASKAATAALRLSGHDAQVLQFSAIVIGEVEGRVDSALVLAHRSVETDPFLASLNTLGDLFMRAGRYDSAVVALRRALEVDPSVPGPRRRLIQSLEHLQRFPDAIAVRREGGDTAGAAEYAREFAAGGPAGYERARRRDLNRQLEVQLAAASEPYRIPQDTVPQLREERIVALYGQLGEWSKAMDWAVKLRERRPGRFRLIVTNPQYTPLRSDPRFMQLVKEDGLEELVRGER